MCVCVCVCVCVSLCVCVCVCDAKQRSVISFFPSDGLGLPPLADEDFQQPQFGFDVFVFVVLHGQRGAVLLLHISMGTSRGRETTDSERRVQLWRRQDSSCYLI